MKLVKIGKIPGMIDISEQKIRELVREGEWKEGVHYCRHSALNHTLYDMEAIEKWIRHEEPKDMLVTELAGRMVG